MTNTRMTNVSHTEFRSKHAAQYHLTQAVDADVRALWGTWGPVPHLAGQSEEEVVAVGIAIQFADVLIWN